MGMVNVDKLKTMNVESNYAKIVERTKSYIDRIDGCDISGLIRLVDDYSFNKNNFDIVEELYDIQNAIYSEWGLDWGRTGNLDIDLVFNGITQSFSSGYVRNSESLDILFNLIESGIKPDKNA